MKRHHILIISLIINVLGLRAQNTSQEAEELQLTKERYIFSVDQIPRVDWTTQNSAQPFVPQNWFAQFQTEQSELKKEREGELREGDKEQLKALVDSMAKYVPESFAFHYASYVSSDYDPNAFEHLKQAQNLRPGDPLVSSQLMNHAEVTGDKQLLRDASFYLSKSKVYSNARMEYHFNLLQGLSYGAILLTNGNGDTHPLLLLQEVEGIRKDVKVVLLELMVQPAYQHRVETMLGLEPGKLDKSRSQQIRTILKEKSPVYLSLTLPEGILRDEAKDSYLTGLALLYAPGYTGNNVEEIATHWEHDWHKEHILDSDPINKNYLLPLLQLYRYYKVLFPQMVPDVDATIRALAERTSDPQMIYQHMEK